MTFRATAFALLLATVTTGAAEAQSNGIVRNPQIESAINSLFWTSDIAAARSNARKVLSGRPHDLDALFIEMDAGALEGDTTSELNAALALCEAGDYSQDERVAAASSHVLDLSGNTAQFRPQIKRIEKILQRRNGCEGNLRAALLTTAMDGAQGLSASQLAHESGLLTDWNVAGPFGKYRNVDFERAWAPETDGLALSSIDGRSVESINALDGTFRLPGYFDRGGVFYAESTIRMDRTANRILRVESPGTLQIWIDGIARLTKDDRFRSTPEVEALALRLSAGKHKVLVKFIATALPFRIAVFPESTRSPKRATHTGLAILDKFVRAENKYWSGNYDAAIRDLSLLKARRESAIVDFWLLRAWHQDGSDPDQESSLAESAVRLVPNAAAVQYAAAKVSYQSGQWGIVLDRLRRARELQPDYVATQELTAEIAIKNGWILEERNALDMLLRLHPGCANLRHTYEFDVLQYDFQRARNIEFQLGSCAPGSLDLAQVLSAGGRHRNAADVAEGVIADYPLDRSARDLQVRELGLSQQPGAAREAAIQLARIAPNWPYAEQLTAASPKDFENGLYDDGIERAQLDFYQRFRRDAIKLVEQSETDAYNAVPAIRLLDQRILREDHTGDFSLYVHTIVRAVTREGVQQYGEVLVPSDATLIELRTIGPDGTVAEPEFQQDKKTVSMPMLVPGSAIDFEYIVHLDNRSIRRDPGDFKFSFGSFQMPVVDSEFIFIAPEHDAITRAVARFGAPDPEVCNQHGEKVERWEARNLERFRAEADMPPGAGLPEIAVVSSPQNGWHSVQETFRDSLIDAIRIGPHVESAASMFGNKTGEEAAREIYRYVRDKIHSDGSTFSSDEITSADDTLAENSGNPTAALISLALANGLHADLVLARNIASSRMVIPAFDAYDRPLVQLTLNGSTGTRRVLLDVEDDDLPFGMLPADIDGSSALLIPTQPRIPKNNPIVSLDVRHPHSLTVADGDVFLAKDGSRRVDVKIQFGDERGAELRSGFGEHEKTTKILQQLAQQTFKNATEITGEIENEHNADQPLVMHLKFRVPLGDGDQPASVSALLPDFGWKNKFSASESRRFPLYVDSPQNEATTMRIHFDAGVPDANHATPVRLETAFGKFRLEVKQNADVWEVRRAITIPLQVVEPADYPSFAAFMNEVQGAQRTLLPAAQGLSARNVN